MAKLTTYLCITNQIVMRFRLLSIIGLVFFVVGCGQSKKLSKAPVLDNAIADSLRVHIGFLADDKLEGRRTGTAGEAKAAAYIEQQFKNIGLSPKGINGFLQPFEVNDGLMMTPATRFTINGDSLLAGKEFFPLAFGANGGSSVVASVALQEVDMPWIFDLNETLEDAKSNPHFDLVDNIKKNVTKSATRGATAIILYNSSTIDDKLKFDNKDRSEKLSIPVLYITKEVAGKYFKDPSAALQLSFNTEVKEKKRSGTNVVGYIDNGALNTVILGAHFDHLGYGEDGNSRHTEHEAAIHNGADDNASGTAALIELARKLKSSNAKGNNYLLIAFSGEELGLYGSKYFTEHPTVDLKTANYMINMDMVGRLNDSTRLVTVGGYGTSAAWEQQLNYITKPMPSSYLRLKLDSSGTGPSDHTSFYRKDIPVLFYFTGLHTDYHKPTDDADKINYHGAQSIVQHILSVIQSLDKQPKLSFLKTREAQTTTSARFSVSLGIMPDYTYSGAGVRADGVSEGRAAQKAGLKAGDIVLQIGDYTVSSMESYMQTLGKFKKGDKTKVKYKRGNEVIEVMVEF
jgi:aminopeptidase YwaD